MGNLALTNPTEPQQTVAALVAAVLLDEAILAGTATAASVAVLSGDITALNSEVAALQSAVGYTKYVAAGAIAAAAGHAVLQAGSAAHMTLANPPSDNLLLIVAAADSEAYLLTCSSGKLSGGTTGTWVAGIGNGLILLSSGGVWLAVGVNNVVIA
jgi:outer membrane murein-binding lipoprotein Lpp